VSGFSGRLGFDAPDIVMSAKGAGGTDVSAGMNERSTVQVVADARLTNASEIRAQLAGQGHRFQGTTDSELIAHTYEEWGPQGVARLRGPFACAVWDADTRRLVLARDHIGLRRLYYALLPHGGIAFASEIHTLLDEHGVGRDWSPEGIDAYLALGYVAAPLTAYRASANSSQRSSSKCRGMDFISTSTGTCRR
jgi:asparagine synthase (glutamine-hydrolysing)